MNTVLIPKDATAFMGFIQPESPVSLILLKNIEFKFRYLSYMVRKYGTIGFRLAYQ